MKPTKYFGWVIAMTVLLCAKVQANGSTNVLSVCDEPSLRAAIATGGWVSVTCNGTVTLTNTINITNNVILDASGVSFAISGGNAVQIFNVTNGASLGATNLTLANGSCIIVTNDVTTNADGGAIYSSGTVTLVGCTLTNNSAQALIFGGTARGGAIFNDGGTVTLWGSSVIDSLALGGGPNSRTPPYTNLPEYDAPTIVDIALGGAIYNNGGTINITGGDISGSLCHDVMEVDWNNFGTGLAMGGAVYQSSGWLMITNSDLVTNQVIGDNGPQGGEGTASPAYGGALTITGGNLSVEHCVFQANKAAGGNAGDATIQAAGPGGLAYGGAIYSLGTGVAADSSFLENLAVAAAGAGGAGFPNGYGCGGGIYTAGNLELDRCCFYLNEALGGPGVYYNDGIPSDGGDALGGGIYNGAQLALTNCTIALNALVSGSAEPARDDPQYVTPNGDALGAGIFNANGTCVMMNDTVATNSCTAYGPGYGGSNGLAAGFQVANTNGTLSLHNTIIAYGATNGNAYGTITDVGHNLSSDGSANLSGPGSLNNTDPLLGPLANYGGPTWCMALRYNSPAIDAGDSAGAPPTDQRGAARPNGAWVDIGAYEFYSNQIDVPRLSLISTATNSVVLSFLAYPSGLYHLLTSSNLISWTDLGTLGPYSGLTTVNRTVSYPNTSAAFYRLLLP